MILLTGATGNVGSKVAELLIQQNIPFRATSRTAQSNPSNSIQNSEKIDWLTVDFNDTASLNTAFNGVDTLILITPADKDMVTNQTNLIKSAVANNVTKIVKLSGLGAGPDAPIRLPKLHYQIEEAIKEASQNSTQAINYVFVRPNLFIQAVIGGSIDSAMQAQKIYSPVPTGEISLIDTADIAEVIVHSVTDNTIKNTAIEITGPEALSFQDIATAFSNKIGKDVEFVAVSFDEAKNSMLSAGMDEWLVDAFIELYDIYEQGLGAGILADNVEAITYKSPISFSDRLDSLALN